MIVEIRLKGRAGTAGLLVCALVVCGVLARQVLFNFIVFSLSDSRSPVSAGALETATSYFPASARLNARLAEAEVSEPSRNLALAASEIERAITLSPNDYKLRVVLASVKESQRDITGAERPLRDAASLAPSNMEVRWRLANLLLRAGQVSDSLTEFRTAVSGNQALIPVTLDLVWNVTGGDLSSLEAVLPTTAQARMQLAGLILKRGRTAE